MTVAERSGPPDTREVMEAKGIFAMARELGFEVKNLQEAKREEYVDFKFPSSHWPNG